MIVQQILAVWGDLIESRVHHEILLGNQDYSVFQIIAQSINDVKFILAERYKPEVLGYDVVCVARLTYPVLLVIDVAPKMKRVTNTLPSLLLH